MKEAKRLLVEYEEKEKQEAEDSKLAGADKAEDDEFQGMKEKTDPAYLKFKLRTARMPAQV